MSQIFENDKVIPVTQIQAGPCLVTQIKTKELSKTTTLEKKGKKDGYNAVQIGFQKLDEKKVKKPQKNKPFKYLKEFKVNKTDLKPGDKITVEIFQIGDKV